MLSSSSGTNWGFFFQATFLKSSLLVHFRASSPQLCKGSSRSWRSFAEALVSSNDHTKQAMMPMVQCNDRISQTRTKTSVCCVSSLEQALCRLRVHPMRTPLVFELHQGEILSEHWFFGVWFGLWEKFGLNENLVWESEETSIYSCWPKCFCLPPDRLPDFRLQFYSDHQQMWNFSNVLHWQDLQSLQFYPRITRKLWLFW